MTIVHSLEELDGAPSVVTIGTFDGVHRGHQLLLEKTIARARELGVQAGVVTFEPIPAMVLRPDRFPGRICSAEEKIALLSAADPDLIAVISFDRALSLQSPELFMSNLDRAFGIKEFWVGEGFALGKDRVGNVERLTEIGRELGFGHRRQRNLLDDHGVARQRRGDFPGLDVARVEQPPDRVDDRRPVDDRAVDDAVRRDWLGTDRRDPVALARRLQLDRLDRARTDVQADQAFRSTKHQDVLRESGRSPMQARRSSRSKSPQSIR